MLWVLRAAARRGLGGTGPASLAHCAALALQAPLPGDLGSARAVVWQQAGRGYTSGALAAAEAPTDAPTDAPAEAPAEANGGGGHDASHDGSSPAATDAADTGSGYAEAATASSSRHHGHRGAGTGRGGRRRGPRVFDADGKLQPPRGRVLNDVSRAGSLEALEGVIVQSAAMFDEDHVASSIARLVVLAGGGGDETVGSGGTLTGDALGRAQRLLTGLCSALLRFPETVKGRHVCAALRGLAALNPPQRDELLQQLVQLMAQDDARIVHTAEPIELAIFAWCLAKLQRLVRRVTRADSPEYASDDEDGLGAAGGGGRAGDEPAGAAMDKLWELLRAEIGERGDRLEPAQLASVLWALSSAHRDPGCELVVRLAPLALAALPRMQPRDFVSTLFSYAKLKNFVRDAAEEQAWSQWWQQEGNEGAWQPWTREVETEALPMPLRADAGAVADEALAVIAAAVPAQLGRAKPYQLAATLSALRFADQPCGELLASKLPAVLAAARHYGDETPLLYSPWNAAFRHLYQLAHAYLPIGWDLARPPLEDGGGAGASPAIAAVGPVAPPTAEQREAVLAVAGACERLLSRAEQVRQDRAKSRGMLQAPPSFRQMMHLSPKRLSGLLRITAVVAPEAAAPLARAVALHFQRAQQLRVLTPTQLISVTAALASAGFSSASALQGQLYPLAFDTLAPYVAGLGHTSLMRLLGAAGSVSPPPAGLLRAAAPPLQAAVATLTPHQLVHTAAVYGRVPSWAPAQRRSGRGGGGGEDGGGEGEGGGGEGGEEEGAPDHWAWDAGAALPTVGSGAAFIAWPLVAAAGTPAPEQDGVIPQLAAALAQRAAELGPARVARPSWRLPEGGDGGRQRLLAFVAALRAMGLDQPGALAALLERALDPACPGGAVLGDASPSDAAALLAALGDAAAAGAGGEEAGAVARVATALAARAGPAATGALEEPQLRALGLQ
ncbi:hypothetical protein Rsub_02997 [Raphidocelis subcapitata]|uniref:RAP domain-containing protein n=1 Tax=Raphidocelis subcapitata TaxID=307507 RepID=A0A2V0P0I4_9CHLO|nr:hypothetical protein Rsub_02997 [Raphidocelis subcapitata]|eukprot:GBF90697.1 hypothetical protein Rsub_02997 [Raphidocelis subcapitata]